MNGYNWTKADTPERMDRLKELLDSGLQVVCREDSGEKIGGVYAMIKAQRQVHGYEVLRGNRGWASLDCSPNALLNTACIEFLDPSPRLEPSELQWSHSDDRSEAYCTQESGWSFMAYADGDWEANFEGEPLGGGRTENMETAKSAIHEWRINHLKSMIV